MFKTQAYIDYNGKQINKIFTSGQVIKVETRNNRTFISLSHYKGKNNTPEYTNNIFVDDKKAGVIKNLKKGTQVFCEINVTKNEKDGKTYENLSLFNFEIGREGRGEVFNTTTSTPSSSVEEYPFL